MRHIFLAVLLAVAASNCPAETLVAQAVVCDNREDLDVLSRDHLKGQSGGEVVKRVKAGIEFNDRHIQTANRLKEIALPGMIGSLRKDIASSEDENKLLKKFMENCTATETEQPVVVVEVKAISGTAKVRAAIKGLQADVWTKTEYVAGMKGL